MSKMQTVAFYSYKGGVGRTLLVANTAQFLALSGRKVVALDLDLEAPGLHQKLGGRDDLRKATDGTLRGAVNELVDIMEGKPWERNLQATTVGVPLPDDAGGSLWLMPAGAAPSHAYWAALEKLYQFARTKPRKIGLPEAVLELQARIEQELQPDFLLIDSRTGITELGGMATSLLADRVVCLTTAAPESVEGTKVVADALRNAPRLASQKPLSLEVLITRVWHEDAPMVSDARKELEKVAVSVALLPQDPHIADTDRTYLRALEEVKEGLLLLSSLDLDRLRNCAPNEKLRLLYQEIRNLDQWYVNSVPGNQLLSATTDWIEVTFCDEKSA